MVLSSQERNRPLCDADKFHKIIETKSFPFDYINYFLLSRGDTTFMLKFDRKMIDVLVDLTVNIDYPDEDIEYITKNNSTL